MLKTSHFLLILAVVLSASCADDPSSNRTLAALTDDNTAQDTKAYSRRAQIARSAFGALRERLNIPESPPHYSANAESAEAVHYYEDSRGMPRGIWTFSRDGLGSTGEDHATFVLNFIRENHELWGLSPEDTLSIDLALTEDQATNSPGGRAVHFVAFDQYIKGARVIDGGIRAVFWDGTLTSVSGMIVLPSEIPGLEQDVLTDVEIELTVERALPAWGIEAGDIELNDQGVHSQLGQISIFHAFSGENYHRVYVRSTDGAVLETAIWDQFHPTVTTDYKVYRPTNVATTTRQTNVATMSGLGAQAAPAEFFPWADVLSSRSPVPT